MSRFRLLFAALVFAASGLILQSSITAQQPVNLTGTWAFEVITENGTGTPTVVLRQQGDSLSGTYESPRLGVRDLRGTVKGDSVNFSLSLADDSAPRLTFLGTVVDSNTLKGEVDFGGMGGAEFTGRRKP